MRVSPIVMTETGSVFALVVTPASAVTSDLLREHHLDIDGAVALYTPRGVNGRPADAKVVTSGLPLTQAAVDEFYRITRNPTVCQLLDFAAAHPGPVDGHVDEECRKDLGITAVRYQQLLNQAIGTDEALRQDPQTTHRLRRLAEHRARERAARTH